MSWILKNKNKNNKALVIVFFLVAISLFFGNIKKADASCTCQIKKADGSLFESPAAANTGPTEVDCSVTCLSWGGAGNSASYAWNGGAFKTATASSSAAGIIASAGGGSLKTGNVNNMESVKVNPDKDNIFVKGTKYVLIGILNVVGWLFSIAATLFTWVVDPANISEQGTGVLQKQAVKDVWIMVRDLLNMTFILILLFAAFCTIFQVEKWSLKKVWLNILINALLVNFSYPIARFFIDISNVAFYYLINNLFSSASGNVTSGGIFAMFGAAAGIGEILKPENYANYEIAYLVTMIIILFIMGMTLLIIAALFVVRLVALTMLVMFSPIGFVGYIFPATEKYANDWWTQLFSYAFFAPIMIFGMAIALKVTEAIGKENMQAFKAAASAQAPADQTSFISSSAFVVIPIVILWATIGVAKKFGIEGADTVVSNVKKGGKWLANAPGKYSGVYGATKKATEDFNKKGKLFGMKVPLMGSADREAREARWSAGLTGGREGYNDAKRDQLRKEASEMRENWKKAGGASSSELEHALSGSQAEKMAAALEMSEKNGFKLNDTDTAAQVLARYQSAAGAVAGDKVLQNNFNDKVKEKHVKLMIQDDIAKNTDPTRTSAVIYKEHLDKLNASKFAGQKGLSSESEVASYLSARHAAGGNDRKFVTKVAEGLSNEDRLNIRRNGFTSF